MTKKKNRLVIDHLRGVIVVERGNRREEFPYKSRKSAEMTADFYKKALGWIITKQGQTMGISRSQIQAREKMRAVILQEVFLGFPINKLQRLAHRGMVDDELMFDASGADDWIVTDLGREWLDRYLRDNPDAVIKPMAQVVAEKEASAVVVPEEIHVTQVGRWMTAKRNGGTFVDVAREAGVSITTVRRLEDGGTDNYEMKVVIRVCRWLGVKRLVIDEAEM